MNLSSMCLCLCERVPWFHEGVSVRTWTKKEGEEGGEEHTPSHVTHPSSFFSFCFLQCAWIAVPCAFPFYLKIYESP